MANKKRETLGGRIGYPGADQEAEASEPRTYVNAENAMNGHERSGEPGLFEMVRDKLRNPGQAAVDIEYAKRRKRRP